MIIYRFLVTHMMALLIIFLLLSPFPSLILSIDAAIASPRKNITLQGFTKLPLPVEATGSLTFDLLGGGPYAGVGDGRVLKYTRLTNSFQTFAYTSPNRTSAFCDGTNNLDYGPICGLPTGLNFNLFTGKLYTCDAFFGLTVVGPRGGLATAVAPTKNGVPYVYLIAVDAANDGYVYFTDVSAVYGPKDSQTSIQTGDSTGRVFRYNPITKNVTLLLANLTRATGVASSSDASFLLIAEFTAMRIRRYWLKGPKAGTSEILLTLPGLTNKIKRNQDGDFWIAVNGVKNDSTPFPQGVKISPSGEILAVVDLSKEYQRRISLVSEQAGKLYVAGRNITYIGVYNIVYV